MIFFDEPASEAGIEVTINDERLTDTLGESYKWGEGFGEIIELMINSEEELRFRNAKALRAAIQRDYVGNKYLNLAHVPLFRGTPVRIVMTGSRRGDAEAADRELQRKLGHLPDHDGYTWHHKEDICQVRGRWMCNMYLIESGYHRRHPHKGGVSVYEFQTSTKYT